MWPDRRLIDLLGTEVPIVQSPMLGSADAALAAAVSNAGGLGSIACGTLGWEAIAGELDRFRQASNGSVNLNFFVHEVPDPPDPATVAVAAAHYAPFYEAAGLGAPPTEIAPAPPPLPESVVDWLCDVRPRVVSFHFGLPAAAVIGRLKDAEIRLIASATTVAEALALEAAGMDAIIAQGFEAGGHRGSHRPTAPGDGVGTLALVPQVVDAVGLPVIAAGGIADGRGIAAALALGASGVQIGTAFLRAPEASTNDARRARLAEARDTDTMVTDALSGRAARGARSPVAEALAQAGATPLPFPLNNTLSGPLVAAEDGGLVYALYGQAAALARAEPAAEIVARLEAETRDVLGRLGARA